MRLRLTAWYDRLMVRWSESRCPSCGTVKLRQDRYCSTKCGELDEWMQAIG